MIVLDTDHLSILERGGIESRPLRKRLMRVQSDEFVTTIVTFEEQMRGWLAYLARARSLKQQVEAYGRLRNHLNIYRGIRVLDFDERASDEYDRLRRLRVRIGSMDLKIAAITITHAATLLSRNLADLSRVPGLRVEDWSA